MEIIVHIPWDNAPDGRDALRRHGPDATDILNRSNPGRVRPGASAINAGRSEHLVESDLRALFESGHLSGAGAPRILDSIRAILRGETPDTLVRMDLEY